MSNIEETLTALVDLYGSVTVVLVVTPDGVPMYAAKAQSSKSGSGGSVSGAVQSLVEALAGDLSRDIERHKLEARKAERALSLIDRHRNGGAR